LRHSAAYWYRHGLVASHHRWPNRESAGKAVFYPACGDTSVAIQLDGTHLKILQELLRDSRRSAPVIGEAVGVGRSKSQRRIKDLEDEGIISQYTVHVDYKKLGFSETRYCFIKVKNPQESEIRPLLTSLKGLEQVVKIQKISGAWSYMLTLKCESSDEYNSAQQTILMQKNIADIETFDLLATEYRHVRLPRPAE
jgi:Lrp/AsnC family leucine-responsive transcriptional regulator